MEAKNPGNASYAWKSILKGREVTKRGAIWRIGRGDSVHVWGDNWFPIKSHPNVISPRPTGGEAILVRDLMDLVYRNWREDVIDGMFYEFEASIIKNIPLCQSIQDDVLIWPFNPDGEYSVKSEYKFLQDAQLMQQQGPSNFEPMKPLWKKIWNLAVPKKVKHLVWKACKNSIPTKANLVKLKVLEDDLCEAYKQHKEDTVHALYRCPLLEPLWRRTPMWNHDAFKKSISFTDIIKFVFAGDKDPELFTSVI